MSAKIIDGKAVAAELRAEIARQVVELKAKKGIVPGLGVILVGENPASKSYVSAKEKAIAEAGMFSDDNHFAGHDHAGGTAGAGAAYEPRPARARHSRAVAAAEADR